MTGNDVCMFPSGWKDIAFISFRYCKVTSNNLPLLFLIQDFPFSKRNDFVGCFNMEMPSFKMSAKLDAQDSVNHVHVANSLYLNDFVSVTVGSFLKLKDEKVEKNKQAFLFDPAGIHVFFET